MGPSRAHATVVALSSSSGGNSTAGQQPGQQPWQSVRQQVGALSYAPRLRMQLQRCAPGLLRVSAPCTSRVPSRFAQQSALVPPACDTLHFFNPFATPTPLLRPTHFDPPPHTHAAGGGPPESNRRRQRLPHARHTQHRDSSVLQAGHPICHDHKHGSVSHPAAARRLAPADAGRPQDSTGRPGRQPALCAAAGVQVLRARHEVRAAAAGGINLAGMEQSFAWRHTLHTVHSLCAALVAAAGKCSLAGGVRTSWQLHDGGCTAPSSRGSAQLPTNNSLSPACSCARVLCGAFHLQAVRVLGLPGDALGGPHMAGGRREGAGGAAAARDDVEATVRAGDEPATPQERCAVTHPHQGLLSCRCGSVRCGLQHLSAAGVSWGGVHVACVCHCSEVFLLWVSSIHPPVGTAWCVSCLCVFVTSRPQAAAAVIGFG